MSSESSGPSGESGESPEERSGEEAGGLERADSAEEEQDESGGVGDRGPEPDVLLDVPRIHVEELNLQVDDLQARVALRTRLSELLDIEVGISVSLDTVKLETQGIEAEAQLKARLENVQEMIERTLSSVDANPGLIQDLTNMSRASSSSPDSSANSTPSAPRTASNGPQGTPGLEGSEGTGAAEEGGAASNTGPTEAAQRKARELGLDLSSVGGTGSSGRVTLRDVQRAARGS